MLGDALGLVGGCCGLVVCVGVVAAAVAWFVQGSIGRAIDRAQDEVTR